MSILLNLDVGLVDATVGAVPVGRSEVVMLPDADVGSEDPFGAVGSGVACCDDGPGETDGVSVGASVDTR